MTIYLASNNAHKKKEMAEIFNPYQIKIPADDNVLFDPEETGSTFVENSLIKAKALWEIVHKPVLADDSGICVDALADEKGSVPGIYSARYEGITFPRGKPSAHGNAKLTSTEQNERLIEHLNTVTGSEKINRSCHYVCSMILYLAPDKFYCIQETLEGEIVSDMAHSCGTGGFGYDPIVFLPSFGKTVAELTADEKNSISHRGKAGRIIKAIIDSNPI